MKGAAGSGVEVPFLLKMETLRLNWLEGLGSDWSMTVGLAMVSMEGSRSEVEWSVMLVRFGSGLTTSGRVASRWSDGSE